jgi:ABC-2 type transport system ATP-binding protein
VQVLGTVEELLERHKLLIGAYREQQPPVAGVAQVVRASHTERQATLLVRTSGPIHDPAWTAHQVTLEDLVLAYLADPSAGALPGPSAHANSLEVHQ